MKLEVIDFLLNKIILMFVFLHKKLLYICALFSPKWKDIYN
jgi:hypothetical protein